MREEAQMLMRALFRGIVADETMAGEAVHIADEAEGRGQYGEAEALRAVSRNHRIRVLETRAHIAMLQAEFGPLSE
jgi:hypothetical protein